VFVGFSRMFLLGILMFKGLTARRLYKSFAVKGLNKLSDSLFIIFKTLTLNLLMSYIQLLANPEFLTSYIYGPTFGNAENRLYLLHNVSTLNQC
jgi:hypothetical protein